MQNPSEGFWHLRGQVPPSGKNLLLKFWMTSQSFTFEAAEEFGREGREKIHILLALASPARLIFILSL